MAVCQRGEGILERNRRAGLIAPRHFAGGAIPKNAKETNMSKIEAIAILTEAGAAQERREDSHGEARSGWWLDGVWLAPCSRPQDAANALKGI